MRYHALATDYDGTIAHHGKLDEPTVNALKRIKETGRKVLLVTGRELDELLTVCPEIEVFDLVVAENGALLYRPGTREERRLAEPPPETFVAELVRRGVGPISVGRTIVATWEPHENTVLDVIREQALELQVIFNKGAVMILPSGVNKASGLAAALEELGLSPHNVVGVGDAENDHAFLAACECGVAVSNALETVKERADWVTPSDHGAGVAELIGRLEADDLVELEPRLERHHILLGQDDRDAEVRFPPYGCNVLVAGTSGSGKSTLTTGLLERLSEAKYQFALIDPEGDYNDLEFAVALGDPAHVPSADGVIDLLARPEASNASVNLLGMGLNDRPAFSDTLLPRLQQLRASTGRPHWIVVDEAHHLLPASWDPGDVTVPRELTGMIFITVHPESVARAVLDRIDLVLAVGEQPHRTLEAFCEAAGRTPPAEPEPVELGRGEALVWWTSPEAGPPIRVRTVPPKTERRRHGRKYAEGNLGPDRSFYFRGPDGALKLRAQNLNIFSQMADGIDDVTWLHHLAENDYARWFREQIKDEELADEAERIASEHGDDAAASREAMRAAIEARYTLPAEPAPSIIDPSKVG